MVFYKRTIHYLKKSLWRLLLILLAPAIILGLFTTPVSIVTYLPKYYADTNQGFWRIIVGICGGYDHILQFILVFVALPICLCYAFSIMERHFKTGKLTMGRPFYAVNNTAVPFIKSFFILLGFIIVFVLLQAGLRAITGAIFSGDKLAMRAFASLFATLFSAATFIILSLLVLFFSILFIVMQVFGYSLSDAFVESLHIIGQNWLNHLLGLIIPVFVMLIPGYIISVLSALDLHVAAPRIVISIASHLFILIYYTAYIMVSVYEQAALVRRDEKKLRH